MSEMQPEHGWFDRAAQDLEMVRRALEGGNPLPVMACYHAQQCLVYLTQLCMAREPTFE